MTRPRGRISKWPNLPPPLPVPEQSAPMDDAGPPEPIVYGDVFDRIRGDLALPEAQHRRIESEIAWLQRNPDYLARSMGRAQRYLHFIVDEVEARELPGELALLPFVESAFNPFGYSRSHAAGLWQFIASTGELYGLKRNYWQDQRRDVLESTRAALDYLTSLYQRFDGDWFLAIAAYNYGAGNIQRAINRNRALRLHTDFFSLSLPAETRAYVPKLIAIAKIIRAPEDYGLFITPIPDAPYFRVVPTDGAVDLRLMAQLAGVDTEELHALESVLESLGDGPGWPAPHADSRGRRGRIRLPACCTRFARARGPRSAHRRRRGIHGLGRRPIQDSRVLSEKDQCRCGGPAAGPATAGAGGQRGPAARRSRRRSRAPHLSRPPR